MIGTRSFPKAALSHGKGKDFVEFANREKRVRLAGNVDWPGASGMRREDILSPSKEKKLISRKNEKGQGSSRSRGGFIC